jgi:hypothetical protein
MTPRLMVVCLGGLAGAGAVVCCDMDEGLDEVEAQADGEAADGAAEDVDPAEPEPEPSPVHH